jgi:hypothetical protein
MNQYSWIDDFRKNKGGSVGGTWLAFCIVTFVMAMLSIFVFENGFQWWMSLPIGILLILAICFSIMYFTVQDLNVCPNCGLNIPDNVDFCKFCGVKIQTVCPKCGEKLNENKSICGRCGYNLQKEFYNKPKINSLIKKKQKPNYCSACGYKLSDDSKFCSICGNRIKK